MSFISTYSGRCLDFENPLITSVDLYDIAWALAHINRFTGHADPAYSVAIHSIFCAHIASVPAKLWALTHDAHEAYIGDMSSPLKALLPDYQRIERKIQDVVVRALLGGWPSSAVQEEVHEIDYRMGQTEARELLQRPNWVRNPYPWDLGRYPYLSPAVARRLWREAYWAYGGLAR